MNDREIPWLPADQAPTLIPLLCYWCPSPDAVDEEDRPEFWGVAVRCKEFGVDRWYQHCPLWEMGLGNPYPGEPDFFAPLGRPEGNPKWVTAHKEDEAGSLQEVVHLKGYNSVTPLMGGGSTDSMREADTDPDRIAASKATMPRLGEKQSTIPLKVDGCADDSSHDDCGCHACRDKRPLTMKDICMVVCPQCGNKRCPKASNHRNICTNSNEPAQLGSMF